MVIRIDGDPAPQEPQEPSPAAARIVPPAQDPVGSLRPLLEQDERRRRPVGPALVSSPPQDPVGSLRSLLEADQRRRQQQGEDFALSSFGEAVKSDPAVRAEAQDLARQLGVDPDVAERNRDVMRQYLKVRYQRQRTLAGINPVLARHMANIEFARIAHDDTDNLGAWERLFEQWDVGKMEFEQGVLGEKLRSGRSTQQDLDRLAFVRSRLRAMPEASGLLEGAIKVLGQQAASLPHAIEVGTATATAFGAATLLAGQAGPQAAVPEEIATVPAAMVTGFTIGTVGTLASQAYQMEAGNAYVQMLDQGYDRDAASQAAVGVGLANAALELVGVKLLAKGAGITAKSLRETFRQEVNAGVADALRRPTVGAAAKQFVKGYGTGLGGEVFTEVAQEAVNITAEEIARQLSQNPDALSSSVTRGEIIQRLVDTAAQTAQGMALLALPGPARQLVRDGRRAARAEHTAQFFQELGTASDASKVRTRNVGEHERFLAAAAAGTAAQNTYVDGQAFAEVLRQADAQALQEGKLQVAWGDQLDRAIPGLSQRIAAAAARAEDVVIPTSELGSKIAGTEVYRALVPHLRLDAEAMSLAEAQVFRQQEQQRTAEAEQILTEADKNNRAFATSARQVEEDLRQQLVAAGRSASAAQTESKLYRDLVVVKAKQLGITPSEFHAQYPLKVVAGELPESGQAMRQADGGAPLDSGGDSGQGGVPDGQRAEQPGEGAPDGARLPGDARAAAAAAGAAEPPRWESRSDVRGAYAARTDLVESHQRDLGADRVTTPAEAAQALAYLGRGAVERFDALVTDKDGRPLALVGSFKGAVDQAAVHLAPLVSEAFRIKGAANIWFAHNHPSGNSKLSNEDRGMHARLVEAFRGSRIQPRGLFAVAGGVEESRGWTFEASDTPGTYLNGTSAAPTKLTKVAVVERVLAADGRMGPSLGGPADGWQLARLVAEGQPGAILLDSQHRPLAFVPVDAQGAVKLRADDRMDALYRAVSVGNPAAVIVVDNGKLGADGAENLARFFRGIDVRVLDVVDTSKGPGDSWTQTGRQMDFGTFKSGTRGFYRPRDFTIFLTKKQNASTFVHELAHHYLAMLADLAKQKAHPRIVDDFNSLLGWFGVADVKAWHALSFAQQEKHHEAFARSFELFLWEGKAPNRALESVFARVARWLREAYGTIVGEINAQYRAQFGQDLPALTTEVREVMGRVLASEHDVEEAAAVMNLADTFESQEQAGMDDATWAEHQTTEEEARDQATTEHTKASLRELQWFSNGRAKLLREKQKQHDATRAKVREEVEAEVRKEPVYRAKLWLERGELVDVDGGKSQQVGGTHKLQTEAVLALLPADADQKALTGRKGILAKDGLLPDVAAKLFGFQTGEQLVQAVLAAQPFEAAVDAKTDARMLEEFGELADPKRRELAVLRALHTEARTRLIAVDLRHVSKALQPVRLLVQAARAEAQRLIARQTVAQVSPRDHMLAEARAARAFTAALKDGDIPAAVAAQKRRLLQHELAKASSQALDEIDEGLEDIARFDGPDEKLAKKRDIDLVYAGRALASAFVLAPQITGTQQQQLIGSAREKLRQDYPALASRVDALLDTPGVRVWRELPLETFRELVETVQALWTEAGKAKVIEVEGRRRELAAVVAEGQEQIAALPTRKAPGSTARVGKTAGPLARFVLKGWNVVANLKRFEHWAWFMDGGKLGWFATHFVLPLRGALGRYWQKRAEVVAKLHPRVIALQKAAGALWDAEIAVPEASLGEEPLVLRGKKELVGLLMHAGSDSNLAKALVPYGFAPNPNLTDGVLDTSRWERFLARMFEKKVLTQEDVEFVRFSWSVYKELLPEDQKTHKALYGFEFATIELRQLHTPWGTLEGGYVPAFVDQDKVQAPRPSSVLESLAGEEQNFLYSISTGRGHTLSRNPNYFKPLALDVALQVQHIDAQLRFTYLQPAIAGILRILRNQDFTGTLNAYDREAVNTVVLPMLDNAARQQASRPSGVPWVDQVANWLRAGTSLAALGFNFVNAVLQLTGFANAAGAVPGRFMRSAAIATGRNPREAVRVAMAKSRVMEERLDQTTRILREDIARAGRQSPRSRTVKKAQQVAGRVAFWPQRMLQGTVDVVTWHAAYQQQLAQSRVDGSLTEEEVDAEAVAYADGVVKRTQGSANPEDLAAYESGTPLMKLLTQFGSYSNVVLNQILGAQPGWGSKLRTAGWVLLVPAIAEATLRAFLQGVPDDDKDGERELEELAMLYTKSLVRNVTGLVPGVGPMALALAESDGQRMLASPAGSTLQAGWRGLVALGGAVSGDDTSAGEARAIGTFLTVITGLPIVPLTRAVGYELDVESGRAAEPTGTVDYLRGLIVGR